MLPDWKDNRAVELWTNDKLDILEAWNSRQHRELAYHSEEYQAWRDAGGWELQIAVRDRNLEPLRKAFPALAQADLLKLPDLIQGQNAPKPCDLDHVVEDVKRIRAIWKLKFKRTQRRGLWSAEEIAARRWTPPYPEDTFEERLASMRASLHNALHPGGRKPIGSRRVSASHS
ncbi:hypothetical protein [Pseudorhodoplanes sp.]|uniref:hypothetical protein n=1 Tax=Pseudorhodoplanes sp. TaxID=1934341 RepID=UPI003D0F24B4